MQIKTRLYLSLLAILLVVLAGSNGYYLLYGGKYKFIDCMYMTVISLSTVGYGEVVEVSGNLAAEVFTIIMITFGMGIIMYGISTLTAMLIEGQLSGILREKKMEKKIGKLKNHYILCGGGETGRHILSEFIRNKEPIVLIEQDIDRIKRCETVGELLYVKGDATDDRNLTAAGIDKARGIIISLPSDKDTLYVTMSARMRSPRLRIISSMVDGAFEPKLKQAGADRVVSSNFIGALRMASEMIRPTAVVFLDQMLRSQKSDLRIDELVLSHGAQQTAPCASDIEADFDLLVLGARTDQGPIEFNPPHARPLPAGTCLIVMGDQQNIDRVKSVWETQPAENSGG